jgi:hypothetical protein
MHAYLFLCHHNKYSYGELPQVYSHGALVFLIIHKSNKNFSMRNKVNIFLFS